jgi:hypothetical protein
LHAQACPAQGSRPRSWGLQGKRISRCAAIPPQTCAAAYAQGLEQCLQGVGTRRLVAVVQAEDVGSQHIWHHRFGYRDLARGQLRQLQKDFPQLGALEGSALLVKDLAPMRQEAAAGQQQGQLQAGRRPWWARAIAAPFSVLGGRQS